MSEQPLNPVGHCCNCEDAPDEKAHEHMGTNTLACQLGGREKSDGNAGQCPQDPQTRHCPHARIAPGNAKGTRRFGPFVTETYGCRKHGHIHDEIELNGKIAQHEIGICNRWLEREGEAQQGNNNSLYEQHPGWDTPFIGFFRTMLAACRPGRPPATLCWAQ